MGSIDNVPDPPNTATTIPQIENGFTNITTNLASDDPFQLSMSLGLDSFEMDQESFNLMYQTMPYEVSEPVMCKFPLRRVSLSNTTPRTVTVAPHNGDERTLKTSKRSYFPWPKRR